MTIYAIPSTPGVQSNWVQRTQLDGVDYLFRFLWSQRDGHWSIDVADQDGVAIASGVRLVTNWPLMRTCVDPRRPPGILAVMDTTSANDADPGFADLGSRFVLTYSSVT
jgi:hypothetical protein